MDEIIVRVARAVASFPRLRLLSCLARHREVNPKALAEKLAMPLSTVSTHLRTLATTGLVRRRKSGAWCYYRAESPYDEHALSGKLAAWLKSRLPARGRRSKNRGLREVRDGSSDPDSLLHATIFEAATAFTDLRRLQMLRYLACRDASTTRELMQELSMSEHAVSRHTRKLTRRGYLRARKPNGRGLVYELSAAFKTRVHADLFTIVRSAWATR